MNNHIMIIHTPPHTYVTPYSSNCRIMRRFFYIRRDGKLVSLKCKKEYTDVRQS